MDTRIVRLGVCATLIGVCVSAATADELGIDLAIPDITTATDDAGNTHFRCEPACRPNLSGEPAIPWLETDVLLPADVALDSLRPRLANATYASVLQNIDVAPTPPEVTWDDGRRVLLWPDDKTIVDGRDTEIYGRDAFWPESEADVWGTGSLRGYQLARIGIPLVQVNPVLRTARVLTSARLVVSFDRAEPEAPAGGVSSVDAIATARVRRLAANFEAMAASYASPRMQSEGGGEVPGDQDARPTYLIIIPDALRASLTQLDTFVQHKQACGFRVHVIGEGDFGGGTGDTAAENIRSWLQANYQSENIEYVLFIGSPHPSTSSVPMKMLWPRYDNDTYREAPSDYYYADLTGNWDLDGDGNYGERYGDWGTGGIDRYYEVIVGRIPHYGYTEEIDEILARTMDYERRTLAEGAWRKQILLPMEPSDDSTPGYHLGEEIKDDFVVPAGWGYHRIYDGEYGLTPPAETIPCNKGNVLNAWLATDPGLTIWWTHGSSSSASDVMDSIGATYLDPNVPAMTFQVSCHNSRPEGVNLSTVVLASGGIATIGATRVSWYYVGQTSFSGSPSNSGMSYEYARRVIADKMTCGQALHDLKQDLYPSSSAMWMNWTVFNIYGDPSAAIEPTYRALSLSERNGLLGRTDLDPLPGDPNRNIYPVATEVTLAAEVTSSGTFSHWLVFNPNHPGDEAYAEQDANTTSTLVLDTHREVVAVYSCAPEFPLAMAGGFVGLFALTVAHRRRR